MLKRDICAMTAALVLSAAATHAAQPLAVADGETTGPPFAIAGTVQTDRGLSVTLANGLAYMDLHEGVSSQTLGHGDKGYVHYCGWVEGPGNEIDNSVTMRAIPNPAAIEPGMGRFVQGFDNGVMGMRVGGKRLVTMPFDLGYGEKGMPPEIPGYSTLSFEINLVRMERGDDRVTSVGLSDKGYH